MRNLTLIISFFIPVVFGFASVSVFGASPAVAPAHSLSFPPSVVGIGPACIGEMKMAESLLKSGSQFFVLAQSDIRRSLTVIPDPLEFHDPTPRMPSKMALEFERMGIAAKSLETKRIEELMREFRMGGTVAAPHEFYGKTLPDGFYPYLILRSGRLLYMIRTPVIAADPDDPKAKIAASHGTLYRLALKNFPDDPVVAGGEWCIRSGLFAYINNQSSRFRGSLKNLLYASAVVTEIYGMRPEGLTRIRDFSNSRPGDSDQHTRAVEEAKVQLRYPSEVETLAGLFRELVGEIPNKYEVGSFDNQLLINLWQKNFEDQDMVLFQNRAPDFSEAGLLRNVLGAFFQTLALEGPRSTVVKLHSPENFTGGNLKTGRQRVTLEDLQMISQRFILQRREKGNEIILDQSGRFRSQHPSGAQLN